MSDTAHAQGRILLVQEHRFRLLEPGGEQRLCELAPSVPVAPQELRALMDEAAPIEVELASSSGTRAQVVKRLWRIAAPAADGDRSVP